MERVKRIKCRHCEELFIPDARNKDRQKYCKKPCCRKASKAASQKKWLSKPENKNYFSGPENVYRVQQWRKRNPGYWRRKPKNKKSALQDCSTAQLLENNNNNSEIATHALQDSLIMQPAVLIGLISHFTGIALQDDIEITLRRLQQLGLDILNQSTQNKGGDDDCQNPDFAPTGAQNAQKLQLDRPPPGPGPAH